MPDISIKTAMCICSYLNQILIEACKNITCVELQKFYKLLLEALNDVLSDD